MADENQSRLPAGVSDIMLDRMVRLWFETYYDPTMSPDENRSQAEAAVNNGWQPISWPKEIADLGWWGN
jgi:hypothetical protein